MMRLRNIVLLTLLNCINVQALNKLSFIKHNQSALEYANTHDNTYILVVFPMANKEDDERIREIAQNYGTIIQSKKLYFSFEKAVKFLRLLYKGHGKHLGKWLGTRENDFKGARLAVKERFSNPDIPLRVYLYQSDSLLAVQKCKFMLRKFLGVGREAIHANDTHEETLKLVKFLFNEKRGFHLLA